jgi:hypothetical protein
VSEYVYWWGYAGVNLRDLFLYLVFVNRGLDSQPAMTPDLR